MTAKRRELARETEKVRIRRHLSLLRDYIEELINFGHSGRLDELEEEMFKNIKDVLDGKADYVPDEDK